LTAFTTRSHNIAVQYEIVPEKEIRDSPDEIIVLSILDISTTAIFQNDPEEINIWTRKTMTMSFISDRTLKHSYQRGPSDHEQSIFGPDERGSKNQVLGQPFPRQDSFSLFWTFFRISFLSINGLLEDTTDDHSSGG
jgi:hypothetical protein